MVSEMSKQNPQSQGDEEQVRQQIAECGKYTGNEQIDEMLQQYKAGKPLAYITGEHIFPRWTEPKASTSLVPFL